MANLGSICSSAGDAKTLDSSTQVPGVVVPEVPSGVLAMVAVFFPLPVPPAPSSARRAVVGPLSPATATISQSS